MQQQFRAGVNRPGGHSLRSSARLAVVTIAFLILALGPASAASAATGHPGAAPPGSTAESQLADKYAPIVVVRRQDTPCGDGEPFRPVDVETVLGNPDVVLRGPDGKVVTTAPTAADLAGKGDGFYLDYPGSPLDPGCDYETWAKSQQSTPTVYAHVLKQADDPNTLVLQYWLFWVFNDWNDKHEGDWEMIQLEFPAADAQAALTVSPTQVAFAQHEGSEVADWNDPKLHRDGDHVAVYPGQGSHAAYFTQSRWFGKSAAAGFGCDDSSAPGVQIAPRVVMLPDEPPVATSSFAWLTFSGRWGELAPSFNNGPTGPNTKEQWTEPVTWQREEGRGSAVAVPPVGGVALDGFCSLTAAGSLLFIKVLDTPWLVLGSVFLLLALVVLGVRRTTWRGGSEPVARQRAAGQIVASSFSWWRRRLAVFAPLGVLGVALAVVASVLQSILLRPKATSNLAEVGEPAALWQVGLALLLAVVLQFATTLWIFAAAEHAIAVEAAGGRATFTGSLARATREPAAAIVLVVTYLVVVLLSASVLLVPVAAWLLARWAVASPAAAFEGSRVRGAFRRSSELTAGHRWRTLWVTLLLAALGLGIAGVVGTLLLLLTSWSFAVCNLIAALVAAAMLMVAAIGFSLQFVDLRMRSQTVPVDTPAAPQTD